MRAILAAVVLSLACIPTLAADKNEANSFVLIVGRAYTMAAEGPDVIRDAVIVVRDGRIEAIGAHLPVPAGLPLVRMPDATVMPGLIDAANALAGAHTGDETVAADYRAVDAYDPYGDYAALLADGVTTIHLNPGHHRLVTGAGAVVKLGGPHDQRILDPQADLTVNLGSRAFNPPNNVTYTAPSSSDVAIPPAIPQRPNTRLGQMLELDESIQRSLAPGAHDLHDLALRKAWTSNTPLRIQVQRAADIEQAVRFAKRHDKPAYLVGVEEGMLLTGDLRRAALPLVVQVDAVFGRPFADVGPDPGAFDPATENAAALSDMSFALAGSMHDSPAHLRLAAATAARYGLDPQKALAAITRVPAEILGVAGRVGTLQPGKDADLVLLSGDPLDAAVNVLRVYVSGKLAFEPPETDALVIRAGTIWTGTNGLIHDGAVLVEKGKITAVGTTVPRPRFANFIDAGPDAFLTPGLIDAHGHLGLEGDRSTADSDLEIADIVGYAGEQWHRVARAGVTSVMLSAYNVGSKGGRVAAIKTAGDSRDALITRDLAAIQFSLRNADPVLGSKQLKSALDEGKKYLETWQKYYEELEQWEKDRAAGKTTQPANGQGEVIEEKKIDPITGTWALTLSGGPLPEPQTAEMRLRLDGTTIEGRIRVPMDPEEAVVKGTLSGTHITGVLEVETPFGQPKIEADLDRDDHMVGTITLGDFSINLEADRTDKTAVEFTITRKKRRGKDGRPLPPKTNQALEPLRQLLEQKIPAVVDVTDPASTESVIKLFAEEYKLPLVLLNAVSADRLADRLKKTNTGVIVSTNVVTRRDRDLLVPADRLERLGIPIAMQSDAEDGARGLPLQALYAVQQGSDPDGILKALTVDAAKMYKLDDRIGSIQPGRDADLVIFSGHPFNAGSRIERVFISGKEVDK